MITVTVDKIDGSDITNDIRAIDPKMIAPGSIRPITANTAGSACIMEVLTWDGNIQNYRAVRWTLTDTYTTIKDALGLTSVTLVEVDGETVTTDIRAIDESMMVAGTMRPKTANNTATAAIFSIQKWDNNTFTYTSEQWEISATYAALKTALDALNNAPYGAATGTDTYAVTLAPAMTSYETGVPFYVKFANTNTGASTLNVNGLGAKDLKKEASTALAASDIVIGKIYRCVYDGTNIQIDIASSGGDGYTETTVTLTELALEGCGTTPITLLAAPAAGSYYQWEIFIKKPNATTAAAGTVTGWWVGDSEKSNGNVIEPLFMNNAGDRVVQLSSNAPGFIDAVNGATNAYAGLTAQAIVFTTLNAADPTSVTGTCTALIRYKTLTF